MKHGSTKWSHKHAPRSLEDFSTIKVLPKHTANLLTTCQAMPAPPNLLLVGPMGCGKTVLSQLMIGDNRFSISHYSGPLITSKSLDQLLLSLNSVSSSRRVIVIDDVDAMPIAMQLRIVTFFQPIYKTTWIVTATSKPLLAPLFVSHLITVDLGAAQRARHIDILTEQFTHILQQELVSGIDLNEVRKIIQDSYPDVRMSLMALQQRALSTSAAATFESQIS